MKKHKASPPAGKAGRAGLMPYSCHSVTLRQVCCNSTKACINRRKNKLGHLPVLTAGTEVCRINGLALGNVSGQLKRGTAFSNPCMMSEPAF